eukprot:6472679-Prymnesium_polylepis.1
MASATRPRHARDMARHARDMARQPRDTPATPPRHLATSPRHLATCCTHTQSPGPSIRQFSCIIHQKPDKGQSPIVCVANIHSVFCPRVELRNVKGKQ